MALISDWARGMDSFSPEAGSWDQKKPCHSGSSNMCGNKRVNRRAQFNAVNYRNNDIGIWSENYILTAVSNDKYCKTYECLNCAILRIAKIQN